jgi:hypothetical protein
MQAMDHVESKQSRSKWLSLRFSLAGLLTAIAVLSIALALIRRHVMLHANQLDVVAEIVRIPRSRVDDCPIPGGMGSVHGGFRTETSAGWEQRIAELMGVDYRADITAVALRGGGDRITQIQLLHNLPALKRVSVGNIELNEGTMKQLQTLTKLEELWFTDPPLSDKEIRKLKVHLPSTRIQVLRRVAENAYETSLDLP